jgi:hypothetical protein
VTFVLDTGPLVAALNQQDPDHKNCADLLAGGEDILLPSSILPEADYWLVRLAGVGVWADFVHDVADGAYRLIHPDQNDIERAAELQITYADLRLGYVDASIVAMCEHRGETRVATLDRRHFSVVRPRHCRYLTLLPGT